MTVRSIVPGIACIDAPLRCSFVAIAASSESGRGSWDVRRLGV